MRLQVMVLAFLTLMGGRALAGDEFDAVRCGANIPQALIGRHSPNERVVVTEARHRELALKDLGADIINDDLNMIVWSICGAEYYMLVDRHDIIRDVLPFPAHSKNAPASSGPCQRNGRETSGVIYSVLDNRAGEDRKYDQNDKSLLPALWAWRVDEKRAKFVKLDVIGLRCPLSAIDPRDRIQ